MKKKTAETAKASAGSLHPMVRWIPVTEHKPKPDLKVLAWSAEMASHGHAISFGKRVVGRVIDECRFENTSGFYFTHWMALPNPPNADFRRGEPDATNKSAGESPSPARNG